jgi:hypothetical protein
MQRPPGSLLLPFHRNQQRGSRDIFTQLLQLIAYQRPGVDVFKR